MVIQTIELEAEFSDLLRRAANRLLVVDFYANWCGPCRAIAPFFEQLSNRFPDAIFAKVNVDYCQGICRELNVQAMPTFVLFSRGREAARLQGAQTQALENLVATHYIQLPNTHRANESERQFLHTNLVSRTSYVQAYEDEVNQTVALSVIPADEIKGKATHDGVVDSVVLAKELMNWFHEFFSWVECKKCKSCGSEFANAEPGRATDEEREDGGGDVEVYNCANCGNVKRFVRYNNPAKLISTREGRCGEWANCFALCCRAMGLETRWTVCTEDHVWVEIFDPKSQRWIHCDPCENVIDRPLLYERGWKKQLRYVFGIAHDHVEDVTWRYVHDQQKCIKRRTLVREPVLNNTLKKLNQRLQKNLTEERKKELLLRRVKELVEFLCPSKNVRPDGEDAGRVSGDIAWRLNRGETETPQSPKPTVITPTEAERAAKHISVEYDCVNDVYKRPFDNNSETKNFQSMLHMSTNVFRKVENDWKFSYVCRKPDTVAAEFSWRIAFNGLKAKRCRVELGEFTLFNKADASATICGGDLCSMVERNGTLELTDLDKAEYVELTVTLRGGEGDLPWQYSQLFRTSHDQPTTNLHFEVEFE